MFTNNLIRQNKSLVKNLKRFSSTKSVVQINFKDIVTQDKSLFSKFEEAYGNEGGILIILSSGYTSNTSFEYERIGG